MSQKTAYVLPSLRECKATRSEGALVARRWFSIELDASWNEVVTGIDYLVPQFAD